MSLVHSSKSTIANKDRFHAAMFAEHPELAGRHMARTWPIAQVPADCQRGVLIHRPVGNVASCGRGIRMNEGAAQVRGGAARDGPPRSGSSCGRRSSRRSTWVQPFMSESRNGFGGVFGLDFMMTSDFRVYPLEVNGKVGYRNIAEPPTAGAAYTLTPQSRHYYPNGTYTFTDFSTGYFNWIFTLVIKPLFLRQDSDSPPPHVCTFGIPQHLLHPSWSKCEILLTGYTDFFKFPVLNAYDSTLKGGNDIFLAKFSPDGTLLFSTLFGRSYNDFGLGVAVDSSDDIVITAYFGGATFDIGMAVAVDGSDNIVITGQTQSDNFPTLNALSSNINSADGSSDIIVALLNSTGSLVFSTYFGGKSTDIGIAIAVDSSDDIVITGYTQSDNFPTLNAISSSNNGSQDIIVAKFSSTGSLIFSTYFGGSSDEHGNGVAVDSSDDIVITGYTYSNNFPTFNAISSRNNGSQDIIVAKFNSTGSLIFSTYFGGSDDDEGNGIASGKGNYVVVAGNTYSRNFPTKNAFDSEYSGGQTGLLFIFEFCAAFDGCSLDGKCTAEETCLCDAGWTGNDNCSEANSCSSLSAWKLMETVLALTFAILILHGV